MGSESWVLGTQYFLRGQTEVGVGLGNPFQRKAVIRPDPKRLSPSLESILLGYWFSWRLQSPYPSRGSAGLSPSKWKRLCRVESEPSSSILNPRTHSFQPATPSRAPPRL